MPTYTAGFQADPTADQVLADTGALAAGEKRCRVFITNEQQYPFRLQHRDAANTGNVQEIVIVEPPYKTEGHEFSFTLALNERLRVVANENMLGGYQAAISVLTV